jgi:hypothetical protein
MGMDLNAILWTLIVGIPILLWFTYWTGILALIFEAWRLVKPQIIRSRQTTIPEYIMDDQWRYLKRYDKETRKLLEAELEGHEDTEESESQGYESSAEIDLEDAGDNQASLSLLICFEHFLYQ